MTAGGGEVETTGAGLDTVQPQSWVLQVTVPAGEAVAAKPKTSGPQTLLEPGRRIHLRLRAALSG